MSDSVVMVIEKKDTKQTEYALMSSRSGWSILKLTLHDYKITIPTLEKTTTVR